MEFEVCLIDCLLYVNAITKLCGIFESVRTDDDDPSVQTTPEKVLITFH